MTEMQQISQSATTTDIDHLNMIQNQEQSYVADPAVEVTGVQDKDTSVSKQHFCTERPAHDNKEQLIEISNPTGTRADDNNILKPLTQEEIDKIVQKHAKMVDEEKKKYLEYFWSVDTYKFGVFTIQQLAYRLRNSGVWLNNQQLAKMFCDLDTNHDFLVSLEEYLQEMSKEKPKPLTTEELELWFKRFDRDNDGYVYREDIHAVMEENGIHIMSLQVEKIMRFDRSGRAERLNCKDFCTAVHRMLLTSRDWEYHPRYEVGHIGDLEVSEKTSSKRIQGTDSVRGARKGHNQIIPELTDKLLVEDTNVESSL